MLERRKNRGKSAKLVYERIEFLFIFRRQKQNKQIQIARTIWAKKRT